MSRKPRQQKKPADEVASRSVPSSLARPPWRNSTPSWWLHLAVVIVLSLVNLAVYQRVLNLGFLSVDDPDYVQNNPYIEQLDSAKLTHIFTVPYFANYAPVNLLSYALDVALAGGKSAAAIHLSSVVWHWWVACMVYLLAFTIRPRFLFAATAAGLFLLHPAHVEVVAWISSRKDLVATGFAALAMTCYLRYRQPGKRPVVWYAASLLTFLVASAGKQSVLLLPAVMLVWDFLVERRRSWRMIADKIPYGLITLFFGWMTWHAQPSTNQALQPFVLAATELANLWLLTGLGQYTVYRGAPDAAAWSVAGRGAIIISATVAWALPLLFQKVRQPQRTMFCYWVLIQMVPPMLLSFVVPITDRYLFLPSVGVCLLFADLGVGAMDKRPRLSWTAGSALALLGVVWAVKTWSYANEWSDPRSVWYGAHFKTKNSQVSQFLGEVYQNAGDRADGFVKTGKMASLTNDLALARLVLADEPLTARLGTEWSNASRVRTNTAAYRDKLWSLAWEQFEQSVANRGTLSTPNLFMTRGRLLVSQGKSVQAIPEFKQALAFAEHSSYDLVRQEGVTHALFAIGVAYWNLGNYREAQVWLLKAQAVQRKSGQLWLPSLDQEVERVGRLAAGGT